MRKLAKPGIKKVGISFSGRAFSNHMVTSAVLPHSNMNVQNILSVIFSIITHYN